MSAYAVTIHPLAEVHHTVCLGNGCVVWGWSILMEGACLGKDCVVATCVEIGRRVVMGDSCRIQHGTAICDAAQLGHRVFVGSCVSIADCRYPRLDARHLEVHEPPVLEDDVVLGCNAVICPGVRVGQGARIGAGAIVTKDVPRGWIVVGNPAHRLPRRPPAVAMNELGEMLRLGGE